MLCFLLPVKIFITMKFWKYGVKNVYWLAFPLYAYCISLYYFYFTQDGILPEKSIKTGLEVLSLNSWSRLVQYDSFREILGSGMKTHLTENDLLRDIFQMGPPPLVTVETKAAKMERVRKSFLSVCFLRVSLFRTPPVWFRGMLGTNYFDGGVSYSLSDWGSARGTPFVIWGWPYVHRHCFSWDN